MALHLAHRKMTFKTCETANQITKITQTANFQNLRNHIHVPVDVTQHGEHDEKFLCTWEVI